MLVFIAFNYAAVETQCKQLSFVELAIVLMDIAVYKQTLHFVVTIDTVRQRAV